MLRLISFGMKLFIFTAVVLVAGHMIEWDGKTLSDQVKLTLSQAERTDFRSHIETWQDWIRKLNPAQIHNQVGQGVREKANGARDAIVETTASERQKLRALIRELNQTHDKN